MIKKIVQHPSLDISIFVTVLLVKVLLLFKEIDVSVQVLFQEEGIYYTLFTLLLIGFSFYFASNRIRRISLLILDFFLSFLLFADIMYHRYFYDFLADAIFFQVGQTDAIKGTIFSLIRWKDSLFFMDIVFFSLLFVLKKTGINRERKTLSIQKKLLVTSLLFIIGYTDLFFSNEHSLGMEARNTNKTVAYRIGIFNYHILDTFYFIKQTISKPHLTSDELKTVKNSFTNPSIQPNSLFGIAKGKNLLMIQNESLSGFLVGLKVNGQEVTPNLNKLVKESYYDDNYYNQVGDGHSSDAEVETLNSLYPLKQGSASVLYGENDYNALPSILKQNGYYTFSAHGYGGTFWNRENAHKAYGFQQSDFQGKFHITPSNEIGWSISDKSFLVQSVDKLSRLPQPFLGYLITLQNHTPFTLPKKFHELKLGKLEGTSIGDYLQSSHNMDEGIGAMIQELKAKGLYKNTVIVMYGDHNAEFTKEELQPLFPSVQDYQLESFLRVPFIIQLPNQQLVKEDHQLEAHIDVTPSMLHLLGIKPKYSFFYGQDMFSPSKTRKVAFKDGSFIADNYFFENKGTDFNSGTVYDMRTGKTIPKTKEMTSLYNQVQKETAFSDTIVRNNLIKPLEHIN